VTRNQPQQETCNKRPPATRMVSRCTARTLKTATTAGSHRSITNRPTRPSTQVPTAHAGSTKQVGGPPPRPPRHRRIHHRRPRRHQRARGTASRPSGAAKRCKKMERRPTAQERRRVPARPGGGTRPPNNGAGARRRRLPPTNRGPARAPRGCCSRPSVRARACAAMSWPTHGARDGTSRWRALWLAGDAGGA